MVNTISSLVGEELEDPRCTFSGSVAGVDGSIYRIPCRAHRVIKFNPLDNNSMTEIGPDFGDGWSKWISGAMAGSGIIYCPPQHRDRGILKIDTNTDTATELDVNLLPERGDDMWESCAVALDGCIYFMPLDARRIMKIDPNNNDAMSSVGDDLGRGYGKYIGTVIGIDGCVYGIPDRSNRIVKYNPINGSTSYVGKTGHQDFDCRGNGVVGRDGCIYAAVTYGRVLRIETRNNSYCIIGSRVDLADWGYGAGWGDGILGIDGCIYWPPRSAAQILKYDPHLILTSLVGDDFGTRKDKWGGGCAAPDGVIYCLPLNTNKILAIDPLKEYTLSLKNNMEEHPEEFGRIFQPSDDIPDDTIPDVTHFDRAVTKFGQRKVLELLDECMPLVHQSCIVSNLYPFMIAASCKGSHVSVIYHLIRQMPSFVHCTNRFSSL